MQEYGSSGQFRVFPSATQDVGKDRAIFQPPSQREQWGRGGLVESTGEEADRRESVHSVVPRISDDHFQRMSNFGGRLVAQRGEDSGHGLGLVLILQPLLQRGYSDWHFLALHASQHEEAQ